MSTKICILDQDIANKIAAGEVIQRPASAVKELLENAVDAGARSVTVVAKEAGRSLIQVVDDGEGMLRDDALLCFQRHSTSKIVAAEDLENIRTLGFRGEALASIAAVAQVEIKTRTKSDETAVSLRIEGSKLIEESRVAGPIGTSMAARNLFFNTPARRQFLKTNATELRNITETVTRVALAYPEIAFRYYHDDTEIYNLSLGSEEQRLRAILGDPQFDQLIPVAESTPYLRISGFVGRPTFFRKSRAEQYLYLNRRFIVSKALNHAVYHAYEHLLEKGSFPFFLLNLTIDPRHVDVNVHPSKMEVKFENESNVYRAVLSAVRHALGAHDLPQSVDLEKETRMPVSVSRLNTPGEDPRGASAFPGSARSFGRGEHARATRLDALFQEGDPEGVAINSFGLRKEAADRLYAHAGRIDELDDGHRETRPIWQLHNKYILSQVRTGIIIIDQHVAHERILYEKAVAGFENNLPSTQQLLFPQTVELTASDYALVEELQPHLQGLGFGLKLFGKNTIVIEGIPVDVRVGNERRILQDVLDEYRHIEQEVKLDVRDRLAKSFACKAAIKAGDRLKPEEMVHLVDQLFATSMPYVCPHGRPVVIRLSIEELDKRFGRT